jgi:fatty acid desaturase
MLVLLLNTVRTFVAHAYKNPGDDRMTRAEEFADSIDIPGHPLITPLWAPVGLRFHATHHLFPSMPYHNLAEARRRLIRDLPDNSVYLASTRKNLFAALGQLIRDARAYQKEQKAQASGKQASGKTA